MQKERLEKLVRAVYRKWRQRRAMTGQTHPNEEEIALFLEKRLSQQEAETIRAHIVKCEQCAEILSIALQQGALPEKEVAPELLERLKNLIPPDKRGVLELLFRLKDKAWEIIEASGEILLGQELVPVPVLRSRKLTELKDEVTVLKDFKDIRVEVKLINKLGKAFDLFVIVRDKATQKVMRDIRITLLKEDLELESYLADSGKVIFEDVALGKYTVEIATENSKLASIVLEIRT